MAIQCGNIVLLGTVGNLICYERNGVYYIRMKPDISRKDFFTKEKYAVQRQSSEAMITAAKLASLIYNRIPKKTRAYSMMATMQKTAIAMLKQQQPLQAVIAHLCHYIATETGSKLNKAVQQQLATELSQYLQTRRPHAPKNPDHLTGVRIRTKEGVWIRLYHEDEIELLEEYEHLLETTDAWLPLFLQRRKALPTYRRKLKKRRRARTQPAPTPLAKQRSINRLPSLFIPIPYPAQTPNHHHHRTHPRPHRHIIDH